jgi:iron complex transport system ATP-binding protein
MARTERARRVAFLPQTRPVPEMTALDLVRHGRYPHMGFSKTLSPRDHSAVDHAVAAADLAPLLGRSLATLSGGERQRAYLAMAIAQETEVLLLDEPSTHLDLHYQLELQHLLARLHTQGKTIIMVAQDLPQAFTFAQHICLMQQGRIVCHQPPPVVQQSGTLEQVFGFSLQPVPAGDGLLYQYSLAPADPPPPEETAY